MGYKLASEKQQLPCGGDQTLWGKSFLSTLSGVHWVCDVQIAADREPPSEGGLSTLSSADTSSWGKKQTHCGSRLFGASQQQQQEEEEEEVGRCSSSRTAQHSRGEAEVEPSCSLQRRRQQRVNRRHHGTRWPPPEPIVHHTLGDL